MGIHFKKGCIKLASLKSSDASFPYLGAQTTTTTTTVFFSKHRLLLSTFSPHSTSLSYSRPSVTDGSRLLLVCDVALGRCKDVHKRDLTLTQAPEGHHSVHGVRRTASTHSEFKVGVFA